MKIKRDILVLFSVLLAITIAISPALAYLYYHGYSETWATGDYFGEAAFDTYTGYLGATAYFNGYSYAWMSSSGGVTAVADVDNIVVTVWYTDVSCSWSGFGSWVEFEVKLNVNDYCQGIESTNTLSPYGYTQFVFDNVDVNYGDELRIEAKFTAEGGAYDGYANIIATLTYVGYTTD